MSATLPTLEDTEQGVTASIASTPSQSEIILKTEPEPIQSQQHPHTIDSHAVAPTSLSPEETMSKEPITTSKPSAHDYYHDHGDHQSEGSTSERISLVAIEEFTTPLEASLSREEYHSHLF